MKEEAKNNLESKYPYNLSYPVLIPLHEILICNGYKIIKKKSTPKNPVLESDNGHRVVISLLSNGNYLYFNPNDNDDRGNIYNLCKYNNLDIHKLLENFLNTKIDINYQIKITNKDDDFNNCKELAEEFLKLQSYNPSINYYLQNRALDIKTINAYNELIKVDEKHNVYFPQYKLFSNGSLNIRGYTMKLAKPIYKKDGINLEKPIKSINKGMKGLEILLPNDMKEKNLPYTEVIISESVIDSLSFLELANISNAILVSTSGNVNIESTMQSIKEIHERFNVKYYYLAFDNDDAGKKFRDNFINEGHKLNFNMFNMIPTSKDFNDDLELVKLCSINKRRYILNTNCIDREYFKEAVKKEFLDLIDSYQRSKSTIEKSNLLKELRKINKLINIEEKVKDEFNSYKYKDKRIKQL